MEEISDEIQGDLVIVGGGGTTPDMHKRILEMAGGRRARILVIPQASRNVDKSRVHYHTRLDPKLLYPQLSGEPSPFARLSLKAQQLLPVIAVIADPKTGVLPSAEKLARSMYASLDTVERALQELQKADILSFVQQRPGYSSVVDKWKEAGVDEVAILDLSDHKRAISEVENADLVWISGGSQRRLMDSLKGTGVPEVLRRHYREGGVIGGSSAGAAVMSKFMITGDEVVAGLGLWPEAMVDQHFLARRRFNRLLRAVLDRPSLIGVGIDERTAVFLHGKSFEVLGESSVLVLDARKAKTEDVATTDVVLHVLRSGMKFDWTK